MSDVPRARQLLTKVLDEGKIDHQSRRLIAKAITLLHREAYIRLAPKQYRNITAAMRRRIRQLDLTDMTQQEIAVAVGLRSSGRVSEVLHGKR